MMTRIASLIAVLGISLAGAACQSSGTGSFSAENDQNQSLNSTNTASSTDINNNNDKLNVHNNMHSNDRNSSGSLSTNGTANER